MTEQYILIVGDPVNGFLYIGTFESVDDAQYYAECHLKGSDWWIHLLDEPSGKVD